MKTSGNPAAESGGRYRPAAAILIIGVTVGRAAYVFFWCPYDLAPDEAHYWDWSRHPDWGYYSKGPLVSWLIRVSCQLFGPTAKAIDGTLAPAVRLPAVLCGGGLLTALYALTWQTFRSDRLSFWVVVGALSLAAFSACSLIMTIDPPFLCCWAWALVLGRCAMIDGRGWAWAPTGLLVAVGILAKQTMAIWLCSAGLFVVFTPTHRRLLAHWGFWLMAAVAGLSAVPFVVWNGQHDWVTIRHVAAQAGVAEKQHLGGRRWLGPLEYLGGQFAVLQGYWFVVWVLALIRYRPRDGVAPGIRYLWWMSVPTFFVFGASSILKTGQVNWPVSAYLAGAVLVGGWLSAPLDESSGRWRRRGLAIAIIAGLVATLAVHDTGLFVPFFDRFLPAESTANPTPARSIDPAARLKGWRHLGGEVDNLRTEVRSVEGEDPVLAGLRWDVPGALSAYLHDHPQAYSLGLVLRYDRHSQYDLWHPNPADEAQAFRGRTFLVVAPFDAGASLSPAFESVAPPRLVVYREHGRAVAEWYVWVCRGFRGIAEPGGEAGH